MCGQIESKYVPEGTALKEAFKLKECPAVREVSHKLPLLDRKNDKNDSCNYISKRFHVSYNLSDGVWSDIEGGRIWSVSFESQEAAFMSFILSDLKLPAGAAVCISNQNKDYLVGPITSDKVKNRDSLFTDFVPDHYVSIYVFEPSSCFGEVSLSIKDVFGGIIPTEDGQLRSITSSNDCFVHVACYDNFKYKTESDAICYINTYGKNGMIGGTGALILTANNSFTPYILTALHIIDINGNGTMEQWEKDHLQNSTFRFKYRKNTCDGSPSAGTTFTGATFRAGWKKTDFALLELNVTEDEWWYLKANMYWLGWDRDSYAPQSGVSLHHPSINGMTISVDDDPLHSYSSDELANSCWKAGWDVGVIAGAASGGPLLDNHNKIRGQLKGRIGGSETNPCANIYAAFGKFHLSWEGDGTSETRLKDWLDPNNTDRMAIDGRRYFTITGNPLVCGKNHYYIDNYTSGMSVSWSLDNSNYTTSNGRFLTYPTIPNKCTVIKDENHLLNNTLSATITMVGYPSAVAELPIHSMNKELVSSYRWVEGCSGPVPMPCDIPSGTIERVPVDCTVFLQADELSDMTVTYTDNVTSFFSHTGNTIRFSIPSSNFGDVLRVNGQGIHSCRQFSYTFYTNQRPPGPINPPGPILPRDSLIFFVGNSPNGNENSIGGISNGLLPISLLYVVKGDTENKETRKTSDEGSFEFVALKDDEEWILEIYQASTNQKVRSLCIKGSTYSLDTSSLASGVYVFRAILDEQRRSVKIKL